MEAIRNFFGMLKKVHFWLLCVFLLGLGVGMWMTASNAVDSEFEQNESKISSQFQEAQNLQNITNHPNNEYESGMQQIIDLRKDAVLKAWQTKWDHQAETFHVADNTGPGKARRSRRKVPGDGTDQHRRTPGTRTKTLHS